MSTRTKSDGAFRRGMGTAARAATAGLLVAGLSMPLVGCGTGDGSTTSAADGGRSSNEVSASVKAALMTEEQVPTDGTPLSLLDVSDMWTERDLDPSYGDRKVTTVQLSGASASADGADADAVSVSDSAITLGREGVYVFSGKSSLPVVVDAAGDAKVQLVLSGADIEVNDYACVYAKTANKLFITVADGTENRLSSTGTPIQRDDNEVDGTVFSKCDLTVNGDGKLTVAGEEMHGIVCKDDLRLMSGSVSVSSEHGHAVQAKDSVAVHDGTWRLSSTEKDGIHAENAENQTRGWMYVDGGTIDVSAGTDGIDASGVIQVDGGSLSIEAGDDGIHAEFDLVVNGGSIEIDKCAEGFEGGTVTVTAGSADIHASDDGINATGDPNNADNKSDGELPGHDGFRGGMPGADGEGDGFPTPLDGEVPETSDGEMPQPAQGGMSESGQGQKPPTKPGSDSQEEGNASSTGQPSPSDADAQDGEGVYSRGGHQGGPQGTPPAGGGMMMDVDETAIVTVAGGKVSIESGGDGIDSNGTIHVTGGETYVSGPVSDGDSAIDVGTDLRVDGGIIVAVGSAGMVEEPSDASGQPVIMAYLDEAMSGDVSLSEQDGTGKLATMSPTKGYASIIVSAPGLAEGKGYSLSTGESSQGVTISGSVTRLGERSQGMGLPGGTTNGDSLVGKHIGDSKARSDGGQDTVASA